MSLFDGFLAWARQVQWLKIGHHRLLSKLESIFEDFEHQGTMKTINK